MGTFSIVALGCVGLVAVVLLLAILRGVILSYLWSWFVVPFGVFELSIAHAIGISLIVGFLTHEGAYQGPEDEAKGKLIGTVLAMPFVLLFGYIIQSYM